jgi:DNA processing protein
MRSELFYQVALSLVPSVGPVQAKLLLSHFSPEEIFRTRKSLLERIEGIGSIRANNIRSFAGFSKAEAELSFIEKFGIRPIFLTDPAYPKRLLNCSDSPILLYYKGEADLNASRTLAVIGSRSHTEYGKIITEQLISALATLQVTIISGLAFGIDALAHKAALRAQLPTLGVLGHGLDQVYPPQHSSLAKEMIQNGGGLLTEFTSGTMPDRHNFPTRNRIVAGLSDAVVVIETGIKGGSMITAELANGYNKDVFAFPGKISDLKSAGCNELIKTNKAMLLTDAKDLVELMGWAESSSINRAPRNPQQYLFVDLTPEEKIIVGILSQKEKTHIDEINLQSGLSSSAVAAAILSLEIQNLVISTPGKQFSLL